ncbi:Sec-independent protein translocase TatB [Microbacterium sp. P06]|uniref:Sec-independent protein translocase TatB n=1 Tax=Microbacterium sp. P06 TaxID=3366949 RepID=UPI003744DD85
MTLGLTFEKLVLIGFIAAMIIGPTRLPVYAAGLRRFVDRAKVMARSAESRVREELGPEFSDTDWRQLDPRRFDPRRIVREALLAEPGSPAVPVESASATPVDAVDGLPERPAPSADGSGQARGDVSA